MHHLRVILLNQVSVHLDFFLDHDRFFFVIYDQFFVFVFEPLHLFLQDLLLHFLKVPLPGLVFIQSWILDFLNIGLLLKLVDDASLLFHLLVLQRKVLDGVLDHILDLYDLLLTE